MSNSKAVVWSADRFYTSHSFELCMRKKKKKIKIFTFNFLDCEKDKWNSRSISYTRVKNFSVKVKYK